ncbi:dimethyl sulfoxide reductase anchor subunit family protein [Amorphus coralli]|uniref:dimethyl sulfoxide reductase anchor subunit family protein n=1 Tax=Amorphus coralli TaxID=340680 RepID=UPI0003635E29|nr:DmsC/YnfH family molybdoenzyme membrane anchor subunit [Amorphus coralli]
MHPAPSIIVFTTLSGIGFGLMAWLGLGLGPDGFWFALLACGLALGFASIGLFASLWHLGNPQRAWRALSQWRSSWLSREGVASIVTLTVFGLYALLWVFFGVRTPWLGIPAAVLAVVCVVCTSMIYGCLKSVPRWSKPPTSPLFVALGLAGGALTLAALAPISGPAGGVPFWVATVMILVATAMWLVWSTKARETRLDADGSSPETAIGLPHLGRVRLLEAPHTAPNYLMREMVFQIGRKRAEALRKLALALGFAVPLVLCAIALAVPAAWPLLLLAVPVHLAGVAASRWLFFAEAQHVVGLYYGQRA